MDFKFINSREIPMVLYSVDLAKKNSKDMTCISYYCSHCKTVFHKDYYDDTEPEETDFQICTNCGIKFRGWYQC